MPQQICAVGGGLISSERFDPSLFEFIVRLAARPDPRVCYLPTASGEPADAVARFNAGCREVGALPAVLSLFKLPTADITSYLIDQDVIVVGGGNTRSMLALWREWDVDCALKEAYERGVILSGSSAGANCWFEQFTTDSVPGDLRVMNGLGILAGSFSPHYSEEPLRRPTLHRLLGRGEIVAGLAADENAGLHFVDGHFARCVSSRPGARAYRVGHRSGRVVEEALPTEALPAQR